MLLWINIVKVNYELWIILNSVVFWLSRIWFPRIFARWMWIVFNIKRILFVFRLFLWKHWVDRSLTWGIVWILKVTNGTDFFEYWVFFNYSKYWSIGRPILFQWLFFWREWKISLLFDFPFITIVFANHMLHFPAIPLNCWFGYVLSWHIWG